MSRHRFFATGEVHASQQPVALPLSAQDVKHAARVLRITAGEHVDVVGPSGRGWEVDVTAVERDAIHGIPIAQLPRVHHAHIALFQGVAKGDKMDAIVRQAVEVGAAEVVPVLTSRSVVRLDDRKRAQRGERWRRIAESAAKQARREGVPHVADPIDFEEAVALFAGYDGALVLWEDHKGRLLSAAVRSWVDVPDARIALFVGPEGGLSEEEVVSLSEAGALAVSLGPSILRTETAAVVGLALAAAAFIEGAGVDR